MPTASVRPSTKGRLRSTAVDLIATGGASGLSIRALCHAVGIRESSFYAHYPSKQALLDDLLASAGADRPRALVEELAAADLPLERFVTALTEGLLALWSSDEARKGRAVLEAEVARSTALREEFTSRIDDMIARVALALARHRASGALRSLAAPDALAWALIAPIAALRTTYLAHGASPERVAQGMALARGVVAAWVAAHVERGRP